MTAEIEEIVVHADLADAEHVLPEPAQAALGVGPRRDERRRQIRPPVPGACRSASRITVGGAPFFRGVEGLARTLEHHLHIEGRHGDLKGPTPEFFFAPTRAKERVAEWGGTGLDDRMAADWKPFVGFVEGWLEVEPGEGPEALKEAYLRVIDGKVPPQVGQVISV